MEDNIDDKIVELESLLVESKQIVDKHIRSRPYKTGFTELIHKQISTERYISYITSPPTRNQNRTTVEINRRAVIN